MTAIGKLIWVWFREDGQQPCTLAVGALPRGEGKVYQVAGVPKRDEAVALVRLAQRPCPAEEQDPQGFLDWRKARRSVQLVNYREVGYDLSEIEEAPRG